MTKTAQLIERIKQVQLRGNTAPRDLTLLDEIVEHLRELDAVYQAARGLSFGTDWNKGTHAITHGYRHKLILALEKVDDR